MGGVCHASARVVCAAAPDPNALAQRYPIVGALIVVALVGLIAAASVFAASRVA